MLILVLLAFGLTTPPCVTARAEARYRNYGYDHLVHVQNGCAKTAACDVSTDVNPKEQAVTVRPGKTATVLTYRGSPSRKFTPRVRCTLGK